MKRFSISPTTGLVALVALAAIAAPDLAFAQATGGADELAPINNVTGYIRDVMTGPLARSVATIAVAVVGYLFYAGRIAAAQAAAVVMGIAMVLGAPTIVNLIETAVTRTAG